MVLQLNAPSEGKRFKEFYGPNNQQMPLLVADGRAPLSSAGLMKRRVEVLDMLLSAASGIRYKRFSDLEKNPKTAPFYQLLVAWFDNYFDTGTGAPRHSNGSMKVAPDAPYLKLLTPKTKLVNGAVPLTNQDYAGLAGVEFSSAEVERYWGNYLSRRAAREHPVWLALAGDKALLRAFADATFALAKERLGYDGKLMYVSPPPVPSEGAAGRLWCVGRLGDNFDYSRADGYDNLDYDLGRLVREAHGAQRAAPRTLEQKVLVPA